MKKKTRRKMKLHKYKTRTIFCDTCKVKPIAYNECLPCRRISRNRSYHARKNDDGFKEKQRINTKKHYEKYAAIKKIKTTEWRIKNLERNKENNRRAYQKNKDIYLAKSRLWKKTNKDKVRKYNLIQNSKRYGVLSGAHRMMIELRKLIKEMKKHETK